MTKTSFTSIRKTLARMVEIGASNDLPSRGYDFLITGVILVNLVAVVLDTFQSVHADTGLFGVYTALSPANMARAEALIREVIDGFLQDGPTQEELDRARGQIKSNLLMGLESTMSRMTRMGQALLFLDEVPPLEDTIARYEAVTRDAVTDFARRTCDYGQLARAVVGSGCAPAGNTRT